MNNLIITTKMAFPIIALINKLKIRDPLIQIINTQVKLQKQKTLIYKELHERSKYECEITGDIMIDLLNQNLDLSEKLNQVEEDVRTQAVNFVFDIIEKIPGSEPEFYKTLSTVTGEKVKELEQKDISEIVEIIMSIVMSKSFMGLLNVMNK